MLEDWSKPWEHAKKTFTGQGFCHYIAWLVERGIISAEENWLIREEIKKYRTITYAAYWFPSYGYTNEGRAIRVEILKQIISDLESNTLWKRITSYLNKFEYD